MASIRDFIEAGREHKAQIAASNPIINTKPIKHLQTFKAGVEGRFSDEKFAPPAVRTSAPDRYTALEDWELWRITIPPEVDSVGWITQQGYSVEVAITERGIAAYRKERPGWIMGNRYDFWEEIDTDKLNEHLEGIRSIQEMVLNYNLDLLDDEPVMSAQEMAEIMEVTDLTESEKDDEIARLRQEIEHLKQALSQVVYDRDMAKKYGVDWKLLSNRVQQKPRRGKLEPCTQARKVKRDG